MNHFECQDALPLIGAYTDGELSEAQAGPLRTHLMSCHGCRNSAQANKASRRWFQRPAADSVEQLVPAGFAARVARLAFAGETGEHAPEMLGHLELTPAPASSAPAALAAGALAPQARGPRPTAARGQLGFLLEVTGIAAAVLVALTVAFRMREMPSGQPLHAGEVPSVQEIKDRLGELNVAPVTLEAPASVSPDSSAGPAAETHPDR